MIPFNLISIAGNLTRDPNLRLLAGDRAVVSFAIANSRKYKVNGEAREDTTFIDCEAWGKIGETIAQHFVKGKPILVTGRLKQDRWEDKDGNNRSKHAIVVDSFCFIPDGRRADSTEAPAAPAPAPGATAHHADDEPPF